MDSPLPVAQGALGACASVRLDELSIQCRGKARGDLVFPGRDDGYLPRPKSSIGWFQAAVKRAGVQKITPHDLRHTCASLAVSAGVNVLALQRILGHTSAAMTLGTYRKSNQPPPTGAQHRATLPVYGRRGRPSGTAHMRRPAAPTTGLPQRPSRNLDGAAA